MRAAFSIAFAAFALSACGGDGEPNDVVQDDALAAGATSYVSGMTVGALVYLPTGAPRPEEDVEHTFEKLSPPIRSTGTPISRWDYARKMGALGYYGPLGPYGPMGTLGPLGGEPWNPDRYISLLLPWSDFSEKLTAAGGPLSARGPLGQNGPLGHPYWEGLPAAIKHNLERAQDESTYDLMASGDFAVHLQPGGVFGILGPLGPRGALGVRGPLGPIGAHGYARQNGGEYWPDPGAPCHDVAPPYDHPPCRKIDVPWDDHGTVHRYELVEQYTEEKAKAMTDNDTSFFVRGDANEGETDEYAFASDAEQWISVLVLPEFAKLTFPQVFGVFAPTCAGIETQSAASHFEAPSFVGVPAYVNPYVCVPYAYDHRASHDDFDLELSIETGAKRAAIASKSKDALDWIQVRVPAGAKMRARVRLARAWSATAADMAFGLLARPSKPAYRLMVVGATPYFDPPTKFAGAHVASATQ